jgi:hypothetical protein
MTAGISGDVFLFAGLGTRRYFSDQDLLDKLKKRAEKEMQTFNIFLEQCLEIFHSECDSLCPEERTILDPDIQRLYKNADSLLLPPESIRSNSIVETVSLYIRQILDLITFPSRVHASPRVVETTGVCTGIIPAVLAASTTCYTSNEFIKSATCGFRLAFWIGSKSALACRKPLGEQDSSWLLSTFGLTTNELETKLHEFKLQRRGVSEKRGELMINLNESSLTQVHRNMTT